MIRARPWRDVAYAAALTVPAVGTVAIVFRICEVIWYGSPIHRRQEVKEFVAGTRGRVRVEALPGYAPDLNPWDEGGWQHLKHVQMRNVACRDLEELHQEFHLAVGRLRQRPHLVRSFFAQAGLMLGKT